MHKPHLSEIVFQIQQYLECILGNIKGCFELLQPSIGERMLRAFLDLVMMCMLKQHPMSAYEINGVLMRDFGVRVGSSTIYSKLYTLEKQGQIHCVMGRSGKVYS